MASSSSWLGGAGEVESAPSTPGERPSADLGDSGFIKHKVLKTDNLAGIAIKYRASVSDIKRLNALASDTAIHAREHVLVPTRPLAPPGEDRAQLALARLIAGFPPSRQQQHGGGGGGQRRGGAFCSEGGRGGGAGSSMRSGASSRTAGVWGGGDLLVGGGGPLLLLADDGECSGGGPASPYSRRSDRTASASEPGDVELIGRGGVGGVGMGGGGGLGGAARALAERVVSRRGRAGGAVAVGPSPSAPNLGAMFHRLSSASNGVADFFSGGGPPTSSPEAAVAAGTAGAATAAPPPPPVLPPHPRRATTSNATTTNSATGGALLRQLSTAFGTTALATVDALTRAASQPALGGGRGAGKRD